MEAGSLSISVKEVVEGEVQIIQSAFADEFEDLREPFNACEPPDIRLKLGPHHTQGGTLHAHVSVTLRIKTSPLYPNEAAEVKVDSYDGISSQASCQLQKDLNNISSDMAMTGTVVMLEICNYTQNFLSEHAKPYSESIYEEMIAGWEAKEAALQFETELNLKQKEKQEEENRIHIQEEIERVQEALREEARQRKEKLKSSHGQSSESYKLSTDDDPSGINRRRFHNRTTSEGSNSMETGYGESFFFSTSGKQDHQIILLYALGHRAEQRCYVEMGLDKVTHERCVVYSWFVHGKKFDRGRKPSAETQLQFDELMSKMDSLQKEMNSLLKLSHENLVAFKGIKASTIDTDYIKIHIIQEYVQGLCLKYYLDNKIPLNEPLLRFIASGLLKAIDYLHKNNIVHRNIRDSCVFLDQREYIVRLSDFGVERRCVEAIMEFNNEKVPSLYPLAPGRGGKKSDIFRIGILFLSLFAAERIYDVAPSIPTDISANFKSFLNHCLKIGEHERWTSDQLLKHPFLNQSTPEKLSSEDNKSLMPLECSGIETSEPLQKIEDSSQSVPLRLPSNLNGYSRFMHEYILLEGLGKGGFGHVYKVRNKVDDRVYALKRVPLHHQSETTRRKMTREVKLLSSLNHENVVRYYTSWIESFTLESKEEMKGSALDDKKNHELQDYEYENLSYMDKKGADSKIVESDSDDEEEKDWLMLSLRSMLCEDKESSDEIIFLNSDQSVQNVKPESKENSDKKSSIISHPKRLQFLYIQMQYCEKNTLRQAIDCNLYMDDERVWRLFIGIASGLDYIHSQGLIHRDLKPGNIFIDSSDHVKIGDFGLATVTFKGISMACDANTSELKSFDAKEPSTLTGQVGTTFYIAPEITKVIGRVSYTNKVDIYSLGIILFEMTYPLATGMERVKILSSLRLHQPQFPDDYENYGSSSKLELILWLLNHDPQQRPTTGELLKSSLVPPPTEEKQKFMSALEAKIENERSQDYKDILNLIFNSPSRPELEATFELDMHKYNQKQLLIYDLIKTRIISIFKSNGALWVPTSFYIPKGSFYRNKENLVTVMSKGGELISAQYELRYPFARFIARNDLKHLRRYSIDRVQKHKISGIHPTEIYECAFDIIGSKQDLAESCCRVMLVSQEILFKVSGMQTTEVQIKITHSELAKLILTHCGVEEHLLNIVINLIKEFRGDTRQLENFGESLMTFGVNRNAVEVLKGFMLIEGPFEDVCLILQARIISSTRRKLSHVSLKAVMAQLKELVEAAVTMGIQFDIIFFPMMIIDEDLYKGITFRFVPQFTSSRKSNFNIFAQGGVYDHLITQLRYKSVPIAKSPDLSSLSAVGTSLPLERIVATVDANAFLSIESRYKFQGLGNLENNFLDLFICALEQRQLKERVELTAKLKAENILVDHGFAMNMAEAENLCEEFWFSQHFVFLGPSDKAICRSLDGLNSARANDRKILRGDLLDYLLKLIKPNRGADLIPVSLTSFCRRESKISATKLEDYTIHIEYITRKQAKFKEVQKIDAQITEDVNSCLGSRWTNVSIGDSIEVFAVDLDRRALLVLGQLDVDSNVRNFNESVTEVKSRLPDMKDYIDRICGILSKKIFYGKKVDRPSVIICYSIPSETLKRIV